jgi:hypothetical protein
MTVLDADGNGTADALSDGILILRYLFDRTGAWNVNDALGSGATRTTRQQIKSYLDQYSPSQAPAGLGEMPIAQSAGISSAATETGATSAQPLTANNSNERLAASIAPSILLVRAVPDAIGPTDSDEAPYVQSPEAANPQASDIILQQWSQNTTQIEEPPTWVMPTTNKDDAEAVDDACGKGGLDWLLMKMG